MKTVTITIHPEIWYPCPDCGIVYTNMIGLTGHFKRLHLAKGDKVKFKALKPKKV